MSKDLLKEIDQRIKDDRLDAIVVEGYDGVGKGKILQEISDHLKIKVYRPDYNFWQLFDHRKEDRWKVSGFFWDIYSQIVPSHDLLLFDRGVLSGAVYNNDMRIADHYKEILRGRKVLHILVTCEPTDYVKFYKSRHHIYTEEDMQHECHEYIVYTDRYFEAFDRSGVDYIVFTNTFDDTIDDGLCQSCGHHSYGICRHPLKNGTSVDGSQKRCDLSYDREVQDINE